MYTRARGEDMTKERHSLVEALLFGQALEISVDDDTYNGIDYSFRKRKSPRPNTAVAIFFYFFRRFGFQSLIINLFPFCFTTSF